MIKVNLTVELETLENVADFEYFINNTIKVNTFTILPDTKNLYDNDSVFKAMVKEYNRVRKIKNDYINSHNR